MQENYRMCLEYTEWRKFEKCILKAMEACKNSENPTEYHFVGVDKNGKTWAKELNAKYKIINFLGMPAI